MASDVSDGVEVKCGSKSERRVRALNIPLRPLNSYGSLECPKLSLQQVRHLEEKERQGLGREKERESV